MPRFKATAFRVTVTGRRPFPIDMLRYDCAHPATESDSNTIERTFDYPKAKEPQTVVVIMPRAPTDGRWSSFLWQVANVTPIF